MRSEALQERCLDALAAIWGYSSFRPGQQNIITSLMSGHDTLAIMPTGGGKSLCYQLPAVLADGITLVVSPLISLMRDQVSDLKRRGVAAECIDSTLTASQQKKVLEAVSRGDCKIVYASPERLQIESFIDAVKGLRVSYVIVDEAHCVSKWGTCFRPEYRQIPAFLSAIEQRPAMAAFTATANKETRADIVKNLKLEDPGIFVAGFDRPNLVYSADFFDSDRDRTEELANFVFERRNVPGIIYCITKKQVDSIAKMLSSLGIRCGAYHAAKSSGHRRRVQREFMEGELNVVVATSAFGMGINKPDVRYVLNVGMRDSLEDYYQNAGRAGRDGERAECFLFWTEEDISLWEWIIEKSIEDSELGMGARIKETKLRLSELGTMIQYCITDECHRKFILRHFGEKADGGDCGSCFNCLMREYEQLAQGERRQIAV